MSVNSVTSIDDGTLRAAAEATGAVHYVHPRDFLLDYLIKRNGVSAVPGYFSGGHHDALQALRGLERSAGKETGLKILEFAAGYGRVARHSHAVFEEQHYVASDIHPEAVEFLQRSCSVQARLSSHEPEELNVGTGYDYIFVLSLFSHLPNKSFGRWLAALYSILAPNGTMLFTTHGGFATHKIEHLARMLNRDKGWGYDEGSDQPDLPGSEYGTMVVTPRYVLGAIDEHCPGAELVRFDSGLWFGLQDEWLIRKSVSDTSLVPAGNWTENVASVVRSLRYEGVYATLAKVPGRLRSWLRRT